MTFLLLLRDCTMISLCVYIVQYIGMQLVPNSFPKTCKSRVRGLLLLYYATCNVVLCLVHIPSFDRFFSGVFFSCLVFLSTATALSIWKALF